MSLRTLVESVCVLARLERVLTHQRSEPRVALAQVLRVCLRGERVLRFAHGLEHTAEVV